MEAWRHIDRWSPWLNVKLAAALTDMRLKGEGRVRCMLDPSAEVRFHRIETIARVLKVYTKL